MYNHPLGISVQQYGVKYHLHGLSINDMTPEYLCELCPSENHPENSGHPVRYYCWCQCLSSSHMVIVYLVLQPPLCEIGCQQILEMRPLLKNLSLF